MPIWRREYKPKPNWKHERKPKKQKKLYMPIRGADKEASLGHILSHSYTSISIWWDKLIRGALKEVWWRRSGHLLHVIWNPWKERKRWTFSLDWNWPMSRWLPYLGGHFPVWLRFCWECKWNHTRPGLGFCFFVLCRGLGMFPSKPWKLFNMFVFPLLNDEIGRAPAGCSKGFRHVL